MKSFYILMFALMMLFGCSKSGQIEQRIGERINSCKPSEPCIVRITDLTDFQWDQMHVFEYGARLDEIEKALGTSFPNYVEFTRRLVFLKDGKIVYREDEPTDIEGPVNGKVCFGDESYTDPHWLFTPDNAVFRAKKKEFDGGVYYTLTQIK